MDNGATYRNVIELRMLWNTIYNIICNYHEKILANSSLAFEQSILTVNEHSTICSTSMRTIYV